MKNLRMKKFNKLISILFLLVVICGFNISNVANAQENNNAPKNNENDTVTFTVQSLSSVLFDKSKFIMTFEKPLSLSNSLIIKPSFWNFTDFLSGSFSLEFNNNGLNFAFDNHKQFRISSDFGIRNYFNEKGKGFYFQAQVGAFYYKVIKL